MSRLSERLSKWLRVVVGVSWWVACALMVITGRPKDVLAGYFGLAALSGSIYLASTRRVGWAIALAVWAAILVASLLVPDKEHSDMLGALAIFAPIAGLIFWFVAESLTGRTP